MYSTSAFGPIRAAPQAGPRLLEEPGTAIVPFSLARITPLLGAGPPWPERPGDYDARRRRRPGREEALGGLIDIRV
ncbi:hypothetical protein [Pseudomonas oligotrophica]|uniref:hypothetical protein n=1 Tax=Pseudomonas oligotrophica TaxID=2912055 RepID=UPI001F1850AA|nr:hypothetical protein [Pseudomonas oligotrophica]MCF7201083.1 hypothetical protein [Pseudomonas oligotrophica]